MQSLTCHPEPDISKNRSLWKSSTGFSLKRGVSLCRAYPRVCGGTPCGQAWPSTRGKSKCHIRRWRRMRKGVIHELARRPQLMEILRLFGRPPPSRAARTLRQAPTDGKRQSTMSQSSLRRSVCDASHPIRISPVAVFMVTDGRTVAEPPFACA